MKRADNKSLCPINLTLEIFGDTWSLLILRDIVLFGKCTFGEFMASAEHIGPSVLAERLSQLEERGIVSKSPDPSDHRKGIYSLTETGLEVLPIIYETAVWGMRSLPQAQAPAVCFKAMDKDRHTVLKAWKTALKHDSSFLTGTHSVVKQLHLS